MREIEMILKDIKKMESRLLDAKANYADVVLDSIEIGYDVRNHPDEEEYRQIVMDLVDELNKLYDEHHEEFYPVSW